MTKDPRLPRRLWALFLTFVFGILALFFIGELKKAVMDVVEPATIEVTPEHGAAVAEDDGSWLCGLTTVECPDEQPKETLIATVTAYNSVPEQTDDTPCEAAYRRTDICKLHEQGVRVCAMNGVPFLTKLDLGELGTCIVMDRMNSRYGRNHVDVHFGQDVGAARTFGEKVVRVAVY